MTILRADLVPLNENQLQTQQWRLIGPDGVCCTLNNPPASVVDTLTQRSRGYDLPLDDALEEALARYQLIAEPDPTGLVMVVGGGLTAAAVCLALAESGMTVAISAPETAPVDVDPLGVHTSAAAAVRAWTYERFSQARIEIAQHWTAITPGHASLVIIATETVQPDRAITDYLGRRRIPHLVVRAHHDLAVVGPLIDQTGPCLGCLDLTQADHDQSWPKTLATLSVRPAQPTAVAAHWAGVQAALETAWLMRGSGTTLHGSTIEIGIIHPGVTRRRWLQHKDCACRCLAPTIDQPLEEAA